MSQSPLRSLIMTGWCMCLCAPPELAGRYTSHPTPPTPELTAEMARAELQRRIQAENYAAAWQSLFPNYRMMH